MRYYVDKRDPRAGMYQIIEAKREDGSGSGLFTWLYSERSGKTVYCSTGPILPTLPAALRSAAEDWDDNGHEGPRVGAVMRAAATRLERKEAGV